MIKPSLKDIEAVVCEIFGVTWDEMRNLDRTRRVTYPRQIAMLMCREINGASYPRLGQHFCRDHSSILSGCRRVLKLEAENPGFARKVAECRAALPKMIDRAETRNGVFREVGKGLRAADPFWAAPERDKIRLRLGD